MTSRRLYQKLLWEDSKRKAWAAALLGLALFFALPVATAIQLSSYQLNEYVSLAEMNQRRVNMAKQILDFMDVSNYPLKTMIFSVVAIVLGVSSFSSLHNKKQVDFYHSLPVKRSLLFAVHVSTGILLPIVIDFIMIGITLVVAGSNGVAPYLIFPAAMRGFFLDMLYYVLFYGTVVLAMMMTGTRLAAILGSIVFFLYFPSLGSLIQAFYEEFFETYYVYSALRASMLARLTPFYPMFMAISNGATAENVVWTVAASIVLISVSFLLYQKRPLEAAGKTMAFDWSKGIIKVLLSVVFGMTGIMFFYSIRESLGWMVFGAMVGTGISHCVIEVIYHSDFKKLFCHKRTMGACMLFVLFFALTFYYDLFRYDEYVPGEGQAVYASIEFGKESWVIYGLEKQSDGRYAKSNYGNLLENSKVMDLETIRGIAREGIRQNKQRKTGDSSEFSQYKAWASVNICYTLKSGRKVYRCYPAMRLDPVLELVDQIYTDPDYKKTLYPGLRLDEKEAAGNLVYQEIGGMVQTLSGSQEQWLAVIKAYQEELTGLSMSTRLQESPIGELLLISDQDDDNIQKYAPGKSGSRYGFDWYDGYFYPVYPSFAKTIKALEVCGIKAGKTMSPENLSGITITCLDEKSGERKQKTYTEPQEMEAILAAYSSTSSQHKNGMAVVQGCYRIELCLKERDLTAGGLSGRFIEGKVPEFVVQDFEEQE